MSWAAKAPGRLKSAQSGSRERPSAEMGKACEEKGEENGLARTSAEVESSANAKGER